MSTVGTITKIASDVIGRAAHAVTHPIQTVSSVTGLARRTAAGAVGGRPTEAEDPPSYPKAPRPRTAQPQEPSTTEPKAASHAAAHSGRGSEPTDDWQDELDEGPDVETPVGTTGAAPGSNPDTGRTNLQQPGTEPLMDPSLTKATKAEAEMMKKASDTRKG